MCTAEQDLRSAIFADNLQDQRTNAVAIADDFARDLLIAADNAFCATKVDNDMAEFDRLNDAGDDFAGTILKFFKLAFALCVAPVRFALFT